MDDQDPDVQDKRIINLAAEVADAPDNVIPRLLIQIQAVLDSYPQGSKQLTALKLELWKYELLQVVVTCLKQDFSKLLDGWNTATKLASILGQACVGVEPPDTHTFYGVFLPDVIENIMVLARKLQNKYIKTSQILEDTKATMLSHFRTVLDAVNMLFSGHEFLTTYVLQSAWILQLLITDDMQTAVSVMGLIQSANRMKEGVMASLNENVLNQILDELIYKLSSSSSPEIGSSACRTLNVICESHPPTVELLCTRYRGLGLLLNNWSGKGIGRDMRKILTLLEAGSLAQAQIKKRHQAASIIQAMWRSRLTRNKIKRADVAIARFQRSFREKRDQTMKRKEEEKLQSELRHMLLLRRRKSMRDLRQKQLEALNILPAADVAKFLEKESGEAAVKIQARWRGHHVRQTIATKAATVRQVKAVVTMQRAVRKWLERVRAKKREPPMWQRPPGLTDQRRVELQQKIHEWRDFHKITATTKEQQAELHEKVQSMLRRNAMMSKLTRKNQMHREALLGRLELDSQLLLNAPKIVEVNEPELENFVCHSVPIATKARHNHNEEMRLLKQPWWKKLGDQYQDSKYEEESEDWKVF